MASMKSKRPSAEVAWDWFTEPGILRGTSMSLSNTRVLSF